VLISLQLAVDHWFYLYIPWFAGPLLIALSASGLGYNGPSFASDAGGIAMETPDEALIDEPDEVDFDEDPDELPDEDLLPDDDEFEGDEEASGGDTAETPVGP
jgi:hypothetical protein